ncbi:MAG TPA: YnbE family lipoprotein [Candidatus Limnocylindria bacterium]|nr:YnbE family lipoprotein [Candidatus Limnocylindria bacterium]
MDAGVVAALLVAGFLGCSPRVAVEPPSEPITINLNVKIEHEIRVKVDRDLDRVFAEESDIF